MKLPVDHGEPIFESNEDKKAEREILIEFCNNYSRGFCTTQTLTPYDAFITKEVPSEDIPVTTALAEVKYRKKLSYDVDTVYIGRYKVDATRDIISKYLEPIPFIFIVRMGDRSIIWTEIKSEMEFKKTRVKRKRKSGLVSIHDVYEVPLYIFNDLENKRVISH